MRRRRAAPRRARGTRPRRARRRPAGRARTAVGDDAGRAPRPGSSLRTPAPSRQRVGGRPADRRARRRGRAVSRKANASAAPGARASASGCRRSVPRGWDGRTATAASSAGMPSSRPRSPSPGRPARSTPELPPDGLWQALRNVWIGNTLQLLLDRPVTVNPGLFAYSMLYPLTDNLLDDPGLDGGRKREFNERFGRRLAGLPVRPVGAREEAVFRLVARIEEEFPRPRFADVHASLLAIHRGQVRASPAGRPGDPGRPDPRDQLREGRQLGARRPLPRGRTRDPRAWSASRSATGSSCSCWTTCRTSRPTGRPDTRPSSRAPRSAAPSTNRRPAWRGSSTACSTTRRSSPAPARPIARTSCAAAARTSSSARSPTSRAASPGAFAARSNASGPSHWPPSGDCGGGRNAASPGRRAGCRLAAARRRSSTSRPPRASDPPPPRRCPLREPRS